MIDRNPDDLYRRARLFRSAIEQRDPVTLPVSWRTFPAGACGDARLLLGKYLENEGCRRLDYVCGNFGEQSHAWLETPGDHLIIDITADQFDEQDECVIVTIDRSFHRRFEPLEHCPGQGNLEAWGNFHGRNELLALYRLLLATIPDGKP